MLYQSARDALGKLVEDAGFKPGTAHFVFDVKRCAVVHASLVADPNLQLNRTEYHIAVDIPPSQSVDLSLAATAINAVNSLNKVVSLAPSERGLPDMQGLMFAMVDGDRGLSPYGDLCLAPYSAEALGFTHEGKVIINPLRSPDGLSGVDPVKVYGFREAKSTSGATVLVRDHEGGGHLRISLATNGFIIDRYDESNRRIAYVFSTKLPDAEQVELLTRTSGNQEPSLMEQPQ